MDKFLVPRVDAKEQQNEDFAATPALKRRKTSVDPKAGATSTQASPSLPESKPAAIVIIDDDAAAAADDDDDDDDDDDTVGTKGANSAGRPHPSAGVNAQVLCPGLLIASPHL
jgi:hypothetical protein